MPPGRSSPSPRTSSRNVRSSSSTADGLSAIRKGTAWASASRLPKPSDAPATSGGDRLEPPPHGGDERERPLGPDQEIQLVARLGVTVQRVAARVLAGLGKAGVDEPPLVG